MEDTNLILKNPLKVKRDNSEYDKRNNKLKYDMFVLQTVSNNQFIGAEDVFTNNLNYTVSAKCESSNALTISITRADFLKLNANEIVRNTFGRSVN